jgi:hypothetical protein
LAGLEIALLGNHLVLGRPFYPYDRILSAVSQDGLHWTKEPGIRLGVGGLHRNCQVYYPRTVGVPGGFRLYHRAGGRHSVIGCAFSTDGLTWVEEPGTWMDGPDIPLIKVDGPEVISLAPGGWRLYYAGFDGEHWRIYSRHSEDGATWGRGRCILDMSACSELDQVRDFTLSTDGAGYHAFFLWCGPGESRVATANSDDGLHWEPPRLCHGYGPEGVQVRNPCVVRLADGRLRMYCAECPWPTALGSRIVSAVSQDGLEWEREPGVRLAPGGPFDQHGVFCPDVIPWGDGWRMYYGGYWGRHWLQPYTLFRHRRGTR